MFERSLSSLIKGLRSHRGKDEARYVATIMDEIKHEIRGADMEIKAEAVLKLTYLQMLGHAPSNSSFHMLEVMSSPQYHLKTVGYLAMSQCFGQETDVLILATNMLKKDLRSANQLEVGTALNGLAQIVTSELAQHLAPDVISLLSHSRPVIRKKAVLVLHAMIVHHPPVLEQALPRVAEKLKDEDAGVASATVNIICELSRHDTSMARSFLPISPQLFELLTTSTNNWMLIKIVKLFGVLTPLEPRLAKRLMSPLTSLIRTTPAMSLLYECIQTVIIGGMISETEGDDLAETCSAKFGAFLDEDDQNLRYIALLGLVKILPSHPYLVAMHQERIFQSMEDDDLSIRLRALDLVSGMASRENFIEIVQQQLKHLDPSEPPPASTSTSSAAQSLRNIISNGSNARDIESSNTSGSWIGQSYQVETVNRILSAGSRDTYANITDFEWYIDTLIRLNYLAGENVGKGISDQLIDICARVRSVRPHAIDKVKRVLEDSSFIDASKGGQDVEIVRAAAWICGEYCQDVNYPPAVIGLLFRPETLEMCDATSIAMVLQNGIKLLAWWLLKLRDDWKCNHAKSIKEVLQEVDVAIMIAMRSGDIELRERAGEFALLLQMLSADIDATASKTDEGKSDPPRSLQLLSPLLFVHALGPVVRRAQDKVTVPDGLDLHMPFVNLKDFIVLDTFDDQDTQRGDIGAARDLVSSKGGKLDSKGQADKRRQEGEERERLRAERQRREQESPFYIGSKFKPEAQSNKQDVLSGESIDDIPILQLKLDDSAMDRNALKGVSADAPVRPVPPQQEKEEMPDEPSDGRATPVTVVGTNAAKGKKKKRRGRGVDEAMLG